MASIVHHTKSYTERSESLSHHRAADLFRLQDDKKTNLCIAVDLTKVGDVLESCDALGDMVSVVKTHVDILEDFEYGLFVEQLQRLARKHRFMIFEDRKFADIGHTVKLQYTSGIYRIHRWADFVTAHTNPGPSVLTALDSVLLLASMSSSSSPTDSNLSTCLSWATAYPSKVAGLISQTRDFPPEFVSDIPVWTPGVGRPGIAGDGMGQKYRTPSEVVKMGADVVIVGRGIMGAEGGLAGKREACRWFREGGWEGYLRRVGKL